jgi:GNAT superfamily N-acetyltransferase
MYSSAASNSDLKLGDAHLRELGDVKHAGRKPAPAGAVAEPPPVAAGSGLGDPRSRLEAFLGLVAPDRLGEVDGLLESYEEAEDMFDALRVNYAVDDNPEALALLTGDGNEAAAALPVDSTHLALLVVHKASKGRGIGPIDLKCLEQGLLKVAVRACEMGATVHLPRIGARDPSTNWYAIERLLKKTLVRAGVPTSVYYFKRR